MANDNDKENFDERTRTESLQEVVGLIWNYMEKLKLKQDYSITIRYAAHNHDEHIIIKDSSGDDVALFERHPMGKRLTCRFLNEDGEMERVADPSTISYKEGIKKALKEMVSFETERKLAKL